MSAGFEALVEHRSVLVDLGVMWKTIGVVVKGRGPPGLSRRRRDTVVEWSGVSRRVTEKPCRASVALEHEAHSLPTDDCRLRLPATRALGRLRAPPSRHGLESEVYRLIFPGQTPILPVRAKGNAGLMRSA